MRARVGLLYFLHDVGKFFALLGRVRTGGGDVSDGDECHCLVALHWEMLLDGIYVVVANPASAETAFRSGEAEMLNGDGEVYISVLFVVRSTHPAAVYGFHAEDIGLRRSKPRAVIAGAEVVLAFLGGDDEKLPRLLVCGGGS